MLKKRFLICLALLVALLVANLVMIQAASSSDLTFTLNSDGTGYVVTKCSTTATGTLAIPSTYSGKPVVEIGREAFLNCTKLTSVTIPSSVKTIGWYSFSGCTGLTSISIPDSVTTIDWFAFSDCTSLTSVNVGNGVTCVDSAAFANCSKLTTVTLGKSVTSIGQSAFKYCSQLSTINIPGSVTSIERYAFYGCDSLSSVTFCGTQEEWNAITKGEANTALTGATLKLHDMVDKVCTICQYTDGCKHEASPAKKENEKAATCEANGSYESVVYCSKCGEEMSRETITVEAISHDMQISEAGYAATCELPGKTDVLTCAYGCGKTEGGEVIAAVGHDDTDENSICDVCGKTIFPTDSKLVLYKTNTSGGDLKLGDDIRATFIVNAKNLSYDEIYLEITMNGNTTIVRKDENSSATVLRYAYVVPAAHMTTDIIVTVYGVKGEETYRGEVLNFSVRKCIDAKMVNWHKAGSITNCNLAIALLDYGAKAQIQFGINTDNLANANLLEEYKQYLPADTADLGTAPAVDTTGKTMTLYNIGTMLQEKVKLSAIFRSTVAIADYSKITIEVKHHRSKDGQVITYTYTSADTDYVTFANSKNIKFYFDKIAPSQMRDEVEFTVYFDGVAVSATYIRSVDMIFNNTNYLNNETMSALVYAIVNYGDAAKAVFG